MRTLPKPDENAEEVFLHCISTIMEQDLKNRLTACSGIVLNASEEFEAKVPLAELHTIPLAGNVNGNVSAREMGRVYTKKMVPKGSPGRALYNKIMAAPPFSRCPLCNQRTVSQLDHHLNKADYPSLVVTPVNLVPSCGDCNKLKLDKRPGSEREETLHPYFDNIENDHWLIATVMQTSPASIIFEVVAPPYWSNTLKARVKHHFKILELASLYGSHAAEEMLNIRHSLTSLHAAGGLDAVRDNLLENRNSRMAININSWQSALYSALAASDWFCNEGY